MITEYDISRYVDKYGQEYEDLIRSALTFIDERELIWEVDIDRDKYIKGIVALRRKRNGNHRK